MHTHFSTHRRGSSLVIVLLSIAAASVVILTGATALINVVRQRGSNESRVVASQMADSALQDGVFRYANAATSLTALGQYGTAGTGQNLTPVTHGFKAGTACRDFAADSELSQLDSSCPSYQLALRTVVTPEVPSTGYTFSSRDIPALAPGSYTKIWLPAFTGNVTLSVLTATCVSCQFEVQPLDASGNAIGGPLTLSTNLGIVNPNIKALNMRATNYNTGVNGTAHRNVITATSGTAFTIGTGFTSVEATGLAKDGTAVRKLAIIRLSDTATMAATPAVSKTVKTVTQQFTPAGYCSPSPDACR